MSNSKGFKAFDDFSSDYQFMYPKSWVLRWAPLLPHTLICLPSVPRTSFHLCRRNSQRAGLYISDFQTADKAAVEELKLLEGQSLVDVVVTAAVAPGANASTDRLSLPSMNAVKVEEAVLDGNTYIFLQFPSETLTNSGCALLHLVAAPSC